MMSLATIQAMSEKAGQIAAFKQQVPYFFFDQDLDVARKCVDNGFIPDGLKKLPHLGSHVPQGYELVTTHFTDATGFDLKDAGGSALSVHEFVTKKLNTENGFAIVDVGQFQVYIGEYRKTIQ